VNNIPSRVIFWTKFNSWCKSYSNKATMLLILQSSSRSGWPLRNIQISNNNGSFTFYVDFYFPLSLPRLVPELTVYIWVTRRVSYKKQELLTLREHLSSSPVFLVGVVLLIFLVFCDVLLCVFTFWLPCCDVHYDFRTRTMFGLSLPPVVCRRGHVLFTLYVFVCA